MKSKGIIEMMKYINNNNNNNSSIEEKMIKYIQSENEKDKRLKNISERDNRNRWFLELTTQLIIRLNSDEIKNEYNENKLIEFLNEIKEIRFLIIRDMASYQTSAPARNYLLSYWLEEKYDIENVGGGNFSDIIMGRPISWSINTLPFHVDPIKCKQILNDNGITGIIELCDKNQIYKFVIKNIGVMSVNMIDYYRNDKSIDWILKTNEKILKAILTNDTNAKPQTAEQKQGDREEDKRGHLIPRIRTGSGALIAILFGMLRDPAKNGIIKGESKAVQFFQCLEFATISKL
eukprot:120008_1